MVSYVEGIHIISITTLKKILLHWPHLKLLGCIPTTSFPWVPPAQDSDGSTCSMALFMSQVMVYDGLLGATVETSSGNCAQK